MKSETDASTTTTREHYPWPVERDRQARYLTNAATLSFVHWFSSRMQCPNSVIYDLGMKALYAQLEERGYADMPPIDVGETDLDTLLEQADSQE